MNDDWAFNLLTVSTAIVFCSMACVMIGVMLVVGYFMIQSLTTDVVGECDNSDGVIEFDGYERIADDTP